MEIMRGKHTTFMDSDALAGHINGFTHVHIDLGTGDGRYVRHVAQADAGTFVIGIDACRENLEETSRRAPHNTLFVIANAHALPGELHGTAQHVTVNFPWSSLLDGLLAESGSPVLAGLRALTRPGAALDVRLNGGALAEAGWSLADGADQVQGRLKASGFVMRPPAALDARALKALPTTWAKRLAFGRDPHAVALRGVRG
jgi:hypothetical protein